MAANSEPKKRSLRQIVGGRLYGVVSGGGWISWLALAVAAFLFILCVLFLTQGADYREDPSALVPRSADLYAETRDLSALLKTTGAWRLWREENRGGLERELAALISARVGGLPVNPPFRWIADSQGAAWSVSRDESGAESWALYIKLKNPETALGEIEVEPGMSLTPTQGGRGGDGVFSLAGRDGKSAFVGVAGPWLILSGDAKLPEFALEAVRRPALSLAGTRMLMPWRRSAGLRGMFSPARAAEAGLPFGPAFAADRMAPEARIAFTASFGRNGGVETNFSAAALSGQAPGPGWRALAFVILIVVALGSLVVILAVLLTMIGWGCWLKALAVKAGVVAAQAPAAVELSEAFREDSGVAQSESGKAPEPEAVSVAEETSDTDKGTD